jgi:hypothetical protein
MKWGFFKKNNKNYPGDQYSREYIDEILASLVKENDLTKIPNAFKFLLTSSKELKERSAGVLQNCVLKLSSVQLLRLDKLFRERTSIDWTYDWRNESPENLLLSTFTEETKVSILGLCTFHPNGYFREKALNLLAAYSSGQELPFLILRCNDWVSEVREKAGTFVEKRIVTNYDHHLVNNLPLIFQLNNSERENHRFLFEKVVNLLSQTESVPSLEQGTKSEIRQIRFFCYKVMIYSKMFTKKILVNFLKLEKQPHLRLLLFNEIISDISKAEFVEYYPILKKDKFPMIRARVLEVLYALDPAHSKSELENALFDKSGVIRSTARFLLTKKNVTDFPPYYINKITQNPRGNLRVTILGLGEVGNKIHVNLMIPFLRHQNVGIVKAAIHAIAMLDADDYKIVFIEMLDHDHKGVSKEAKKSLLKTYYKDDKDTLYRLYLKSNNIHTKYNVALLLCSLPKWDAIPYIIEFYVNKGNDDIYSLGNLQLSRWIINFNRSFEAPNKSQIDSIRQAINRFGSKLERSEKRHLEFFIKGF